MRISPIWTARLATAGLLLLSAVPVIAGAFRVTTLAAGAEATPENARFVEVPLPVVVHIIGATLFCVLGAFQFHPGLRRRRPRWHRLSGRVLVPSGVAAALSGMWMTLFYDLPEHDGTRFGVLGVMRLVLGAFMAVAILISFRAILRRDIVRHRAWMIRGYAIGMAAGTQVLTVGPSMGLADPPGPLGHAMLMGLAWLINILVAEWIIRRPEARRRARASAAAQRRASGVQSGAISDQTSVS
ncbi:DUF2306 domain-containing protein [Amorphoplanes digitatis]|uniref:Putative membrane protein n=1 Tax=Actinoplanes digitatis TaxID=1868 RepID=A0A7W7HU74_9ACTN|nr:DUF2306 domain-containing protein [Actinoplanes digitatis]MBB4760840.1 putative membrane protein [Actinoplanes digitatis]GID97956.1 membrane protein [Actinoplanes digitatis]